MNGTTSPRPTTDLDAGFPSPDRVRESTIDIPTLDQGRPRETAT